MRRWGQTLLAVSLVLAAVPSSAPAMGFAPASKAVAAFVSGRFPTARHLFVNCPGNNRIPLGEGTEGIACEFRFLVGRGAARDGIVGAEASSESWSSATWTAVAPYFGPPAGPGERACSRRGLPNGPEPAGRLVARRVPCEHARELANRLAHRAYSNPRSRLPRRFSMPDPNPDALGFVVTSFKCTSKLRIRNNGGAVDYLVNHQTVRCRNRFGDRVVYVFESPA